MSTIDHEPKMHWGARHHYIFDAVQQELVQRLQPFNARPVFAKFANNFLTCIKENGVMSFRTNERLLLNNEEWYPMLLVLGLIYKHSKQSGIEPLRVAVFATGKRQTWYGADSYSKILKDIGVNSFSFSCHEIVANIIFLPARESTIRGIDADLLVLFEAIRIDTRTIARVFVPLLAPKTVSMLIVNNYVKETLYQESTVPKLLDAYVNSGGKQIFIDVHIEKKPNLEIDSDDE